MCGIAGIISTNTSFVTNHRLRLMTDAISHRGEDGDERWINANSTAGFGHRRLCIIDTSEAASQPMHYLNRYTIVHNGEIYNYLECRDDLQKKGYQFGTSSDTEVILAAYDHYKDKCLEQFDGMFAFAIWDEHEQELFCARDRFGEKPFYYSYDSRQNVFSFASELKALIIANDHVQVNNELLLIYLAIGHTHTVHDPSSTFYTSIRQLPASHALTFRHITSDLSICSYWVCDKSVRNISQTEAIEKFNDLFTTSIKRRLRSDVSLGTSLSGGLDSSSIVAKMSELYPKNNRIKSFSAVFTGFAKDESKYIKEVVDKFNLESFTVFPDAGSLANDLSKFLYHHDTPVISASVYAQYKVFELAKQQNVTVLLDGQGSDEIFAGYNKYLHWYLQELWRNGKFTKVMKEKKALKENGQTFEWGIKNYLAAWFPGQTQAQLERKETGKIFHHPDLSREFIHANYNRKAIYKPSVRSLNDMLHFNTFQSGLDELLRYADTNSMAHGREVRLPFLSHELVSFVFSLPPHFKIRDGWTKWLLRHCMQHSLPGNIVWRKDKIGFEPPQQQWMTAPAVQEMVHDATQVLIKNRILKPSAGIKKSQPSVNPTADWRYLIAGNLLSKKRS